MTWLNYPVPKTFPNWKSSIFNGSKFYVSEFKLSIFLLKILLTEISLDSLLSVFYKQNDSAKIDSMGISTIWFIYKLF